MNTREKSKESYDRGGKKKDDHDKRIWYLWGIVRNHVYPEDGTYYRK